MEISESFISSGCSLELSQSAMGIAMKIKKKN